MSENTTPEKETPANETQNRQNALLRYMVVMFAVALVLVLLSMVLQNKDSNSTITQLHTSSTNALQKAEALQNKNRELEEKLASQKTESDSKIFALQKELEATRKAAEALQKAKDDEIKVYTALLTLLSGSLSPEDPLYAPTLKIVEDGRAVLSVEAAGLFDAWRKAPEADPKTE